MLVSYMDVILMHLLLGISSKPAEGVSQGGSGIFRQRGVGTAGVPSRSKRGESCHSDVLRLSRGYMRVASGHRGWRVLLLGVGSENRVRYIFTTILVEVRVCSNDTHVMVIFEAS